MKKIRHILGLSGGKDSAALAIYMRDKVPDMEYVFCDTGKELEETHEFLNRMEAFLGKNVVRLAAERSFEHYLKLYGGYLPSSRMRWCTRQLKLKPFEDYIGEDHAVNYVGIRFDESRDGYISTKSNIRSVFPFREDRITKEGVLRILEDSGVGLPAYYSWRSRSGCFFCFYQRKEEWLALSEVHPKLFKIAKSYEKVDPTTGERFTWRQGETLDELVERERAKKAQSSQRREVKTPRRNLPLVKVWAQENEESDPEDRPCLICDL